VYVEEIYFVLGWLEQPKLNKNIFYRNNKPNGPTKEGHLSYVLFESPFTSVSTVSRGYSSLFFQVGAFLKLAIETHGVHLRGCSSLAGLGGPVQENIFPPD
jgi:hypothetical protein